MPAAPSDTIENNRRIEESERNDNDKGGGIVQTGYGGSGAVVIPRWQDAP